MTHVYRCRYLNVFAPNFLGVALYEEPIELEIIITYDSPEVRESRDLRVLAHYVIQHLQTLRSHFGDQILPLSVSNLSAALRMDHFDGVSNWLMTYNEVSLCAFGDSFWIIMK